MRALIIFSILVLSSCAAEEKFLDVFSYSSPELQSRMSATEQMSTSDHLNLMAGEYLLFLDKSVDKVYQIKGPVNGVLDDLLQSDETSSFAKEYFGFILDNMKSPKEGVKKSVYGGTSRGDDFWFYAQDELIVSDLYLRPEGFSARIEQMELRLDGEVLDVSAVTEFDQLRSDTRRRLEVKSVTPVGMKVLSLILASSTEAKEITQFLSSDDYKGLPLEAKIGYCIENNLITELKSQLRETNSANEFIREVSKALL